MCLAASWMQQFIISRSAPVVMRPFVKSRATSHAALATPVIMAEEMPWHGQQFSAALTLPPLGVVWLVPEGQ